MIIVQIPLVPNAADQQMDITLENQPITIRLLWNTRFEYWSLTLRERDGADLVTNVKMVNNYPLIGRFRKWTLKGDFYFLSRSGSIARPTFDDVATEEYQLFYYNPETPPDYPTPLLPLT